MMDLWIDRAGNWKKIDGRQGEGERKERLERARDKLPKQQWEERQSY